MTFAQLIRATKWSDVKAALLWLYPCARESIVDYRDVLHELRRLSPSESPMRICIKSVRLDGEDPSEHVYAKNGSLNRDQEDFDFLGESRDSAFALAEAEFAIGLERRSRWLGMTIDDETRREYPGPQIIAHCLWEMTFYGFAESDVIAFRTELDRRVAEADAMTEDERRQCYVPIEEVMERLKSRQEPPS